MAKARDIPGLSGDDRFRAAAAKVVEVRLQEIFDHAAGVLDTDDIERVHDMRVATRRLRAVLEIFAPCFPRKVHRAALRDVRRLADALGERRDPDVQIAALEGYAAEAPAADGPGVEAMVAVLRERQGAANRRLGEALLEIERADLQGRLRALVREAVSA
jgi:CHAD domain-containing protein